MEANVKGYESINSLPVDENVIDKDLNGDGKLSIINKITIVDQYVGAADNNFITQFMYPSHTEFLHTVRYLGFNEQNEIVPSTRMEGSTLYKKMERCL